MGDIQGSARLLRYGCVAENSTKKVRGEIQGGETGVASD